MIDGVFGRVVHEDDKLDVLCVAPVSSSWDLLTSEKQEPHRHPCHLDRPWPQF